MADTYDTDIVSWSEQQAELLRRLAAGERVNDQLDWPNIIEEVEAVGRSELRAVTSPLTNAMEHKLCSHGWPDSLAVRHWEGEAVVQLAEAAGEFRESMRRTVEPDMARLYRLARLRALQHMIAAGPPTVPLPDDCPWTLDALLAKGEAALRRP
jgi:Domain of unknown function DUF29